MKKLTTILALAAALCAFTFSSCASKKADYIPPPAPEVVVSK